MSKLDEEIQWFEENHEFDSDWTSKSVLILLKRIRNSQVTEEEKCQVTKRRQSS